MSFCSFYVVFETTEVWLFECVLRESVWNNHIHFNETAKVGCTRLTHTHKKNQGCLVKIYNMAQLR